MKSRGWNQLLVYDVVRAVDPYIISYLPYFEAMRTHQMLNNLIKGKVTVNRCGPMNRELIDCSNTSQPPGLIKEGFILLVCNVL